MRTARHNSEAIRMTFRSATQPATHDRLVWERLSPAERLRRAWRLRRLRHPDRVRDEKLFVSVKNRWDSYPPGRATLLRSQRFGGSLTLPAPAVFNANNFFHALEQCRVRYLLISGQATVLYGASTFSEDVDLWVDLAGRNWQRTLDALAAAGCGFRTARENPKGFSEAIVELYK